MRNIGLSPSIKIVDILRLRPVNFLVDVTLEKMVMKQAILSLAVKCLLS